MKPTIELLEQYIGGQAEIQKNKDEDYLYRGEIKSITIKDNNYIIIFNWIAELDKTTATWKLCESRPWQADCNAYAWQNIGPGSEGGDRFLFHSDLTGELVVLFPPDGSKLDFSRVEQVWGEWVDVTPKTLEELKLLAGTAEGVKIVRNNLYQVIIRTLMPKEGDIVDQPPDMIWLSIKSIDQSARHDWRHFQRIKNELVGSECEGLELYPAESRCVDASNQFHLFVLKDPKFRLPVGFNERYVVDECDATKKIGAVQRPFEKNWPGERLDPKEVGQKLNEFLQDRIG